MGRHIQAFKLNLTYTVIQGDAEGLGALGRSYTCQAAVAWSCSANWCSTAKTSRAT
jgi:hypothetical protein